MINVIGNAWDLMADYDALCVTTNGFVKSNGECVMGRGIALEAKQRFPTVPKLLGALIRANGNIVQGIATIKRSGKPVHIVAFPVKHKWDEAADIELIRRSASQIIAFADKYGLKRVLIPRPGCGNGRLRWNDVQPVLDALLDDRFHIVSFK